jgi:hypothetical protein
MTQPGSDWVVTTSVERVDLDDQRQAKVTFSVQNMRSVTTDTTVVIITDETAKGWFTINRPTRPLDPGAVAPFEVEIAVPPDAPGGEYAFQGKAYSFNEAAEERSGISNRLQVPAAPTPPPPRFKLWWLAVPVALVLIVATVVTIVFATRPDATPAAAPTTEAPTVTVPDLSGLEEPEAVAALEESGLVADVKHRHDPANVGAVTQSVPAGTEVARGSSIEVVVAVILTAPTNLSPANGTRIPPVPHTPAMAALPSNASVAVPIELTWEQAEPYVTRWLVATSHQVCALNLGAVVMSGAVYGAVETVTTPSFSAIRYFRNPPGVSGIYSCGSEIWQVGAIDDFGNLGPVASSSYSVQR